MINIMRVRRQRTLVRGTTCPLTIIIMETPCILLLLHIARGGFYSIADKPAHYFLLLKSKYSLLVSVRTFFYSLHKRIATLNRVHNSRRQPPPMDGLHSNQDERPEPHTEFAARFLRPVNVHSEPHKQRPRHLSQHSEPNHPGGFGQRYRVHYELAHTSQPRRASHILRMPDERVAKLSEPSVARLGSGDDANNVAE